MSTKNFRAFVFPQAPAKSKHCQACGRPMFDWDKRLMAFGDRHEVICSTCQDVLVEGIGRKRRETMTRQPVVL